MPILPYLCWIDTLYKISQPTVLKCNYDIKSAVKYVICWEQSMGMSTQDKTKQIIFELAKLPI